MISKWVIKAVIQKTISFLPRSEQLNYFFQKNITKGVLLTDDHFELKVQHARDHIDFITKYVKHPKGLTTIELGSGWYPIIPMILYLCDISDKVISVDIRNWMTRERKLRSVQKLIHWQLHGKLKDYSLNLNEDKWKRLLDLWNESSKYTDDQINEVIGLQQIIADARKLDIKDRSVDFICSNNTLEHINEDDLVAIFSEFKRVLKPTGFMSHFIDCSDHFAHFDQKISIYNFLRYSKKKWKFIDNRIQPQNRMRFVDYKRMYSGLDIPITEESIRKGNVDDLRKIKIHKEFSNYTEEDLAISHGYIVTNYSL